MFHVSGKIQPQMVKLRAKLKQRVRRGMIRMIRTITVGSCVSIQGLLVKQLDNGQLVIRVGDQLYQGSAVPRPS
jgi:hypothetical protein